MQKKFLFLLAVAAIAAGASARAADLVGAVSSPQNDYNLSFDEDERTMVFARSEAEFRNARIFIAQGRGGGWTTPEPISFSDPRYSDSDPWLTPDGNTLYFISNRPAEGRAEGRTDTDIWRSVRSGSGWSAPEHLGSGVNGPGPELGPELHQGVLYFSSVRRGGRGGLDIYAARQEAQGFGPAALLDGPFNGAESESDFTISRDGRTALFWRSGPGGTGTIHVARKSGDAWSDPAPLPASINHGPFNFTPSLSRNGRSLFYASTRERPGQEEGLADIYSAPLPNR
jgi:hypothetical protein